MSALENQVGGDHYKNKAIQPIEYIMANELDFCEGNVVKYITRWKDKGGVESLRKIKHYVDFLIEREINGETQKDYGGTGSRQGCKTLTKACKAKGIG